MSDGSFGRLPGESIEVLRKVQLLQALTDADLWKIREVVDEVEIGEGSLLFEEGDPADTFYVVVEGAVEIVRVAEDGDEVRVAVRRAGEGFGEMGLVSNDPRSATARVVESGHLLTIRRADFEWLLGGDSFPVRVLQGLSRALREAGVRFASEETIGTPGAVARAGSDDVSRTMHASLLPQVAPRIVGYEVAGGTTTEDAGLGGSAWDWFDMDDGRTVLMTLSTRPGAFPPAYHIGVARAVLRALNRNRIGVQALLAEANDALSAAAVPGLNQFVDVGFLALGGDRVEWASAGQVQGGLIARDGAFQEFGGRSPSLGMMGGFKYQSQRFDMGSGGIAVALSPCSEGLFRGAADLVVKLQGKPAGEVVSILHRGVRQALGDDRTETSVLYLRKH